MLRSHRIAACALIIVAFVAPPAQAQFYGGFGYRPGFGTRNFSPIPPQYFGGLPPVMPVRPLTPVNRFNPLMFNPLSPQYSPQLNATLTYSAFNRLYSQSSYSPYTTFTPLPSSYAAPYGSSTYGSYMSGSSYIRDYGRAQDAAAAAQRAQDMIVKQGLYEKQAKPQPEAKANPDGLLVRALASTNEAEIASGSALNPILAAATTIDRGEKIASDFLTPQVLEAIRFTGSPEAELLNLLQGGGKLEFPDGFKAGELADLKPRFERDFAAATAPALAGKPNDPAKTANLEATIRASRVILNGAIQDMDFEQATAARRFVNRLDSAATVLQKPEVAAVVVPRWRSEGVAVAELARHMSRFKLQFAPAAKGDEAAYVALHRALSNHLFALLERSGAAKK